MTNFMNHLSLCTVFHNSFLSSSSAILATWSLHCFMAALRDDDPVTVVEALGTHVSQQTTILSPMLIIPKTENVIVFTAYH